MKNIPYQQNAVNELTDKTIRLLNLGGKRHKIVCEAPTGAGKTVMTCQALANITDELKERGDSRYQEVAYIWFAPRKLHLQSYVSLKNAFGETRKLRPVMFDEIDQSEGIQSGEILFVNWESVNKESNVMVRENESFASLYDSAVIILTTFNFNDFLLTPIAHHSLDSLSLYILLTASAESFIISRNDAGAITSICSPNERSKERSS